MKKRLAVIGGGVSGVTLARLVQGSFNVTILSVNLVSYKNFYAR